MVKGYEDIGCDVINIGGYELAGGGEFLDSILQSTTIPFISANLISRSTGKLFTNPYVILERPPFKVGVIGITNLLKKDNTYFDLDNMYEAGNKYIRDLKRKTDIIVLMVNAEGKDKHNIQDNFTDADYIIMSRDISRTRKGHPQAKDRPPIYNPGKQGKYMGLLELEIAHIDSNFVDVSYYDKLIDNSKRRLANFQKKDPDTPLKELYSENQAIYRQIITLEKQLVESEEITKNATNKIKFDLIPMNRGIKDDEEMLAFVDHILLKDGEMRKHSKPMFKK